MSEEYNIEETIDVVENGEDNIDQENTTEAEEGQDPSNAEGAKIKAILDRKNKKIAELEQQLGKAPQAEEVETTATPSQTGLTREEAILFAKGLSESEVEQASKIAQLENVSLTDAIDNPLFKAWKGVQEESVRKEQAQLAPSKGSPEYKEEKSFDSSELSRDEHMALFKQKIGR